jgi:hypothetical protein
MVHGKVKSEIERDYDEGGDEDADDEHPLPDLRDDDEEGSEDEPEHSESGRGNF